MARTITALFDTRADAEAGAARLREAGIDATHVNVHDQASHTGTAPSAGAPAQGEGHGLWATLKNAVIPHEDRHTYEEGIRRGGFLLTADVDDGDTPTAVAALEDAGTIDLDERTAQWRAEGWEYTLPVDPTADAGEPLAYGSREADVGGSRYRSYVQDRG